jgi:hypothetical protein
MEKQLGVLTVTLDYPPPLSGGYGVMCAQVCTWLKRRGHEVLVLTALPAERGFISAASGEDEGIVPVRRTLRSYWDGSACLNPPFQEALTVERHNQAQMREVLATYRPDVVVFWHMGDMSLGLISTTARLGFPLVFVIGDEKTRRADRWLALSARPDHLSRPLAKRVSAADPGARSTLAVALALGGTGDRGKRG